MASFENAFQDWHGRPGSDGRKNVFKLVADPKVTARILQGIFEDYGCYKGTTDIWSLVAPPPGVPLRYDWKSKPNGEWLIKVSGLL